MSQRHPVRIAEPMTALTDYALAILCGYFCWRMTDSVGTLFSPWPAVFLWTGIAALVGGSMHGFAPHLDELGKRIVLRVTLGAMTLASYNLIQASISSATLEKPGSLSALNSIVLLAFMITLPAMKDFRFATVYYLLALGVLTALHASTLNIGITVCISAIGAVLWLMKFSPHPQFNHNDLFHVIQGIALWFLYKGVAVLIK